MKLTIGKYACRPVVAVEAEASVRDALRLMRERRINRVVVLSQGDVIGLLTEKDVVFATNWFLGQPELRLKEVMDKPVMTVPEDFTIAQTCQLFAEHPIRHLVVLNARRDTFGIFSQVDLVSLFRDRIFENIPDVCAMMSTKVLQIAPEISARYALSLMARRSVSTIVVIDQEQPIGMFTEREVVRSVADGMDLNEIPVGQLMNPSIVTIGCPTTPEEVLNRMQKKSIRQVLVVDDDQRVIGILTPTDLGRALELQQAEETERLCRPSGEVTEAAPPLI
ncbi:MAG: CBS domain-containing protein [Desulfuromonadales bacterium]|jgi:CBS domain-containing protein